MSMRAFLGMDCLYQNPFLLSIYNFMDVPFFPLFHTLGKRLKRNKIPNYLTQRRLEGRTKPSY